ncbi:MAG: hypothetical protein RL428_7 [Actinomycetota bacterium]|jgi:hypothetical protein
MWKINLSLILVAIVAISISRRMRLNPKYERNDKKAREISDWNALDRGIDPTITDGDK